MMQRILFTLGAAYRAWPALRKIRRDPHGCFKSVTDISPSYLQQNGIQHLLLDFDGVLAPHGDITPLPEVEAWLGKLFANFDGKIALFTNKPLSERFAYFSSRYPNMSCLQGGRKKPYPDMLLAYQQKHGCAAEAIMVADDRLLTGILCAHLVGAQAAYISPAQKQYWQRPFQELGFECLRKLERFLFW